MVFCLFLLLWYLHREKKFWNVDEGLIVRNSSVLCSITQAINSSAWWPGRLKINLLWTFDGRGTCSVFQECRGFNCTHQVLFNIIEFSKSKGLFVYFPKLLLDSIMSNKSAIKRMNSLTALLLLDPATWIFFNNIIDSGTEWLIVYQVYQLKQSLQGGRFQFTFRETRGMFLVSWCYAQVFQSY